MTKRRRYDPADDSRRSYDAAVEAKRARGDIHWPQRAARPPDPETERQLKRLKRALDGKLREAETAEGRKGGRPPRPMARPARSAGPQARQREGKKDG